MAIGKKSEVDSLRGGAGKVPASAPSAHRRRIAWGPVLRHVILAVFAVVILFPILWMLLLSVKSVPDANQNDIWPRTFEFGHYGYALSKIDTLPTNFANSVLVTFSTVVITTVCAILAGYAMVFLQVPGIGLVFALLVA